MKRIVALTGWLGLCGWAGLSPAWANDVTFEKDAGKVHVTGTVEIDDSSGDIVAVTGEASGAASGKYQLSRTEIDAEVAGKLKLHFDRRNQQITASLDGAEPVTLWQKP
jgi:hypothetical protein